MRLSIDWRACTAVTKRTNERARPSQAVHRAMPPGRAARSSTRSLTARSIATDKLYSSNRAGLHRSSLRVRTLLFVPRRMRGALDLICGIRGLCTKCATHRNKGPKRVYGPESLSPVTSRKTELCENTERSPAVLAAVRRFAAVRQFAAGRWKNPSGGTYARYRSALHAGEGKLAATDYPSFGPDKVLPAVSSCMRSRATRPQRERRRKSLLESREKICLLVCALHARAVFVTAKPSW